METRVADANEIPIPEETSFISCHFKSIGVCVLLRAETGGKCNGETEIETETERGKEGLGMGNREKQERKKGGTKKKRKSFHSPTKVLDNSFEHHDQAPPLSSGPYFSTKQLAANFLDSSEV